MAARSLKSKLPLTLAAVLLLTVAVISALTNFLVNRQFRQYVADQQRTKSQQLVRDIGRQYDGEWDVDALHIIGMQAMYDGYLIRVEDGARTLVWATEEHDSTSCAAMMADITSRMKSSVNGAFTSTETPLLSGGALIGYATVTYYGPYFLSDSEFQFLATLNRVLLWVGGASLLLSLAVGLLSARRLIAPVLRAAAAAKRMADGDYRERIAVRTNVRETDELIASVNHLGESLERQEALRRRLISDVAHELRTPLTTVGTHMEAMIDGVWEPTPERLQSCHEELLRLGALVSDMENLARIEGAPKLSKRPVELRALADSALAGFQAQLLEKGLRAAADGGPVEVPADPDRLRQVLINLIANAVKYTSAGGKIEIRIWEDGDRAGFTVSDTGCGISEGDLPHVFERFYRADQSRNRISGGSGIGLAIVRSIAEAHGGTASAESAPGKGSSFTVSLPKSV